MAQQYKFLSPRFNLVNVDSFDVNNDSLLTNVTMKEIVLAESLTTPALQTSVTLQSKVYDSFIKTFGSLKNQNMTISLSEAYGSRQRFSVTQKIYRMDNREMMPLNVGQTEQFTLHACDQTLLNDAKTLVSQSWKCVQPSSIVSQVLRQCAGASRLNVENSTGRGRDYIAENIHPFQVVAQQANVALAQGDDPSFVHFMTYDQNGGGIHNFRSLKKMIKEGPIHEFRHGETGQTAQGNYFEKDVAISFSFPCDFDYLSDLLNGLNENGQDINSLATYNPASGAMSLLGNQAGAIGGCGVGGGNAKQATTNQGTAEQQNSCNVDVEKHLLKRQARMGLLERDKVALRLTVPWNPGCHVGDVLTFNWFNKKNQSRLYGSGNYLIVSLTHVIKLGGLSYTTLDCVSQTALSGG